MTIDGDEIREVECFKYLGSFVQIKGGFGEDEKHRIRCGCIKWREATGVLCDKTIPMRLSCIRV